MVHEATVLYWKCVAHCSDVLLQKPATNSGEQCICSQSYVYDLYVACKDCRHERCSKYKHQWLSSERENVEDVCIVTFMGHEIVIDVLFVETRKQESFVIKYLTGYYKHLK